MTECPMPMLIANGEGPEFNTIYLSEKDSQALVVAVHKTLHKALMVKSLLALDLSRRAANVILRSPWLNTVEDALTAEPHRLSTLRGCGALVRREIRDAFREQLGLELPNWEDRAILHAKRDGVLTFSTSS